jgi:maltodextrin utilization protein YvdJ
MFRVVTTFEDLPSEAENESVFLTSLTNQIYVKKDNDWVTYESLHGNFIEVSSICSNSDFTSQEEVHVFEDAVYYDDIKFGYIYYVEFSANEIQGLDEQNFELMIVAASGTPVLIASTKRLESPLLKCLIALPGEVNEKSAVAFNIKVSNGFIKGPFCLKFFKPGDDIA